MLNEHHNAPFCMQAKATSSRRSWPAITKRVKIVLLGNPLPLAENPVRLAEELAMIDMISKGRLVSGFVRGGGQEQLATGVNPAYNRERFEEAHDLIVKTWTQPGPFRWEGTHYQHRVVNPWAVPLQKPHPRVWIPGVLSKETVDLGGAAALSLHRAEHRDRRDQEDLGALRHGRPPRSATRAGRRTAATCSACHVAETEEKAIAERAAVHVDAGRVHRPRPPGVGQARRATSRRPYRRALRRVRGGPRRRTRAAGRFEEQIRDSRSSRARRRR